MTISVPGYNGEVKTTGTDLTTTNATAVFTATSGMRELVIGISVANTDTANSCYFTIQYNDGSTDYDLRTQYNLAAKEGAEFDFPIGFRGSGSIKVTAENANDLHVVVTNIELPGRVA